MSRVRVYCGSATNSSSALLLDGRDTALPSTWTGKHPETDVPDGWRCQSCGLMSNLEVHHQQFRSQSGDDSESNRIPL